MRIAAVVAVAVIALPLSYIRGKFVGQLIVDDIEAPRKKLAAESERELAEWRAQAEAEAAKRRAEAEAEAKLIQIMFDRIREERRIWEKVQREEAAGQ